MRAWHAGPPALEGSEASDGCCPVEGCLHACLPGRWRDEWMAERAAGRSEELGRLVREGTRARGGAGAGEGARAVRRDEREVAVSRAVEQVRGALGGVGGGAAAERKKSVKVVAPGEE